MIKLKYFLIFMGLLTASTSCSDRSAGSVDALYERMTQEERIAQLQGIYMTQFFDKDNRLDTALCNKLIPNGVGHISQFELNTRQSPDRIRDMVAQMQEWLTANTPSGIPALLHEEALTGVNGYEATVYPQQIGLACSFNTELAEKKTFQTATQMRKVGGFLALSPMVDVVRNPSFNRLEESYGEDGYLSAEMGVAFVKGLQHDGNLREGVAACTKHFLGYGGGGDADEKELMQEILMPHEAIIRTAGSKALMPGYHKFGGTKCVASDSLLQGILRDYLGFDGMVVSDYGAIEQIDAPATGGEWGDIQRAAAAINAGCDVDFPEGVSYKHLQEAIDKGLVSEKTLETAVKRVLKFKQDVGMLDSGAKLYEKGHIEFDTPEERQLSYQLATQSVVLLKNDNILPLKEPKKILLTGPNAHTMWAMLGDYTYNSMRFFWKLSIEDDKHPHIVTLKDGMAGRMPKGGELLYSRGCEWTDTVETIVDRSGDPRTSYMYKIQNRMISTDELANPAEALKLAEQSDVIVAAMGENAILCGEGRDRTKLRMPGRQEEYVEKLVATGKPVVLVLFGGRAQVISGIADKCAAVVQAWYPGEEGGNAVADILYGNVNPSAKLSVSYPAVELNEPICYNSLAKGDPRIAWPFGYGLSYTTFEYSNLKLSDTMLATEGEELEVSLEVKNTGSVDGDEIVQIYISPVDRMDNLRPIQLQGFKRVELKAGETKTVEFTLSPQQFGYCMGRQWHIDQGVFAVKVGASSADIRQASEVTLTGDNITMPLRTQYFAR